MSEKPTVYRTDDGKVLHIRFPSRALRLDGETTHYGGAENKALTQHTDSRCISKIIAGGQTGVDRAALDVALALGIPCGGWCPRGRRAEDGRIPLKYPLNEALSRIYTVRSRLNVLLSDGTLVIRRGTPDGITVFTMKVAREVNKPLIVVDSNIPSPTDRVLKWINANGIASLNVTGPRESRCPGIYEEARASLADMFRRGERA